MEVKEFVKTILKDVTEAVDESKTEKRRFYLPNEKEDGIDFDLAVTLKQSEEGKAGFKVLVAEGGLKGEMSEEIVNRIKFRVTTFKTS